MLVSRTNWILNLEMVEIRGLMEGLVRSHMKGKVCVCGGGGGWSWVGEQIRGEGGGLHNCELGFNIHCT
jgi:hypothetical protein